jgi:hypothetical protein
MIKGEDTSLTPMWMSPAQRLFHAVLSAGVLAIIFLAFHCFAKRKSTANQMVRGADVSSARTNGDDAIRPSHIDIPEEQLIDLRRRIAAAKWPERETVNDATQGVQARARLCVGDGEPPQDALRASRFANRLGRLDA